MSAPFLMQAAGNSSGAAVKHDRPQVVIAEDHDSYARMLRTLLEPHCDILATVADGRSLVDATRACRPDVIVTDIDMPIMTGLEAARIILREQPRARIVFVTGYDDRAIIRYAMDLGALGYVSKPDAVRELREAIQTILEGNSYISTRCWTLLGRPIRPDGRWPDDIQ